jgi:hypothetical protein
LIQLLSTYKDSASRTQWQTKNQFFLFTTVEALPIFAASKVGFLGERHSFFRKLLGNDIADGVARYGATAIPLPK